LCQVKLFNISSSSTYDFTGSAAGGVTGSYNGNSIALKILIAFSAGLIVYNSLELIVLIFITFA
jgi:hypothetical protein